VHYLIPTLTCYLNKTFPFKYGGHAPFKPNLNICYLNRTAMLYYGYHYTGCNRRKGQNFGSVPYYKIYRYNPKHLYPKLNGYGDNDQRIVLSSGGSTHCTCQLSSLIDVCP